MRSFLTILLFAFVTIKAWAQYPAQAGLPGSTAISASSAAFVGWAQYCTVQRGLMNIADPSLGYASAGDSSSALGIADGAIVSLGDSGVATLTFASPVYNGPGADFAVFENGFIDVADATQAFLELAFVEVSSDGSNYFRFPSASLTQAQLQLGNGDYTTASNINNLAGKYVGTYGTPFDLSDMAGISGLDINHITHVRIVDAVGDITQHACRDADGRVINDPFPTPFPSSGFDLDAVGVLHNATTVVNAGPGSLPVSVYPNPATDYIIITADNSLGALQATVTTIAGTVLLSNMMIAQSKGSVSLQQFPAGMYYLTLQDTNGNKWVKKIIKL